MFKDYKYLRMATQNEDCTDTSVPYLLINTDSYFVPNTTLKQHLHETSQDGRGDQLEAITDFIERLDLSKTIWRTIAPGSEPTALKTHQRRMGIYLNTSTRSTMINTGIEDLTVGDVVYAMPAISYLAKNNPSVTTFTHQGKLYLHPMLLSAEEHTRIIQDLLWISLDAPNAKPATILGCMITNLIKKNGDESINLDTITNYMTHMRPVGLVEYSLDAHRQSIYNITTIKAAVGSEFICLNNVFH